MRPHIILSVIALLLGAVVRAIASDLAELELELRFAHDVHPFLETYCLTCHSKEKYKGKLDLSHYSTMAAVVQDYRRWETVLERLKADEMPPEDATQHPSREVRQRVIDWLQAMRKHEADRNAGDPGAVLARRLSNAEYDYTIRDLTGVDIRPTREFPVDPANEAGFDNSGESLTMSPALLKKYLDAARQVAEHIVLTPKGFVFAPHPVVTETDRDKYSVRRIIEFYHRQSTNYVDYFMTAWRFKNRGALGKQEAELADLAAHARISPKYLATIWAALEGVQESIGPLAALQSMWRELPTAGEQQLGTLRQGCERMSDFVFELRRKLKPEFKNLSIRGIAAGSQPLVLWKDRQYAANHFGYARDALHIQNSPEPESQARPRTAIEQALLIPADETARGRYETAFAGFCRIFPDAFYVPERGLVFLNEDKESRGRLLSAGFHLMVGYFRDDAPLYELMLDADGQRELDSLWQEFNFTTSAPMRQYKDFIFFERAEPPRFMQGAEYDFARSEDKDVTSEVKIKQLAEAYLAKARRNGGEGAAIEAIQDYFKNISAEIRSVEADRIAAESSHIEALLPFAERAHRSPLSPAEREDLLAFYRSLREKDGLDHEGAIRDTVVSVLLSPKFCYLMDLTDEGESRNRSSGPTAISRFAHEPAHDQREVEPARSAQQPSIKNNAAALLPALPAVASRGPVASVRPLSDYALASRLSYFMWSSMPDYELLGHAAAGDLHRPDVIVAQSRRMLRDGRIRGLATEFGGNWLDFRRFEEHNAVDRERFKDFNNELRQAMFEEPIHFFVNLVREDRSVLDFLYADYTFVNPILAKHYAMPELKVGPNDWVRVNDAHLYERGGLLPMSVFLTKNAPGLRTSPVKRGYWVVRRLLGEYIPPPPPKVPDFPNDEAKLGNLSLREMLAKHREDRSCAGCHEHFDSFGLVFEGYGPVGERRVKDLGGRPVDARATFPGGIEGVGLNGLRAYLRAHRQDEFLDNLCRKLLSYALGRSLMLSDDGAIRDMRAKLSANGNRFESLVESIVTSPQFLNQRAGEGLTKR